MASHGLKPDGSDLPRSLSEQLRILEQQLNRLSDSGSVRLVHPRQQPLGLPMSLGRPVGLAPPVRKPMLGVPEHFNDDDDTDWAGAPTRRRTFRRRAVISGVSLLLLSSTAVIPSLWHLAAPQAPIEEEARVAMSLRTEQFAHTARELGQIRFSAPELAASPPTGPAEIAPPAPDLTSPPSGTVVPMPAAGTSAAPSERYAHANRAPMTTLTVAESDLPRLSLPMLVSGGGGPSWAGSAIVIDGLPAGARVSHGLKIAPDTWTVGVADVAHAVLSLPPTTPDRLELSVRVLAANSHELAASGLQINVLRSSHRPAQIMPAARFEPAAAEMELGTDVEPRPAPRPTASPATRMTAKTERSKPPARPALIPAAQPEWSTTTSGDMSQQRASPSSGFAPLPSWAPFSDR